MQRTVFQTAWTITNLVLVVVTALGAAPVSGQSEELTRLLDPVISPAKYRAEVGACVIELPSGTILYEKNGDLPLAPASNMKLLTTAAAVDTFGAEHMLITRLARKGDTLALIGAGDPGFGDPKIAAKHEKEIVAAYNEWATALEGSGSQISHLVFDDTIFDEQWQHDDWKARDLGSWFAAPVGGLCFNDSCVDVELEATAGQTEVFLTPGCSRFEVVNHSRSGRGKPLLVHRPGDTWQLLISGQLAGKSKTYSVNVPDPGLFAATALHDILKSSSCPQLTEPKRQKVTDQSGRLLDGWVEVGNSQTAMADILERCNTDSQNLFAESLFKMLGAHATGAQGSWASGRVAVMQFLRKHNLPTDGVVLSDGSGLSKENRVSAKLLASMLATMHARSDWKIWLDSLAVAGDSGTLRKRFRGAMEGKVYAKTGYISGVSALSGYIDCGNDRWVAFSFLYNKISSTAPAKQAQEQACQIVYKQMQTAGRAHAILPARER